MSVKLLYTSQKRFCSNHPSNAEVTAGWGSAAPRASFFHDGFCASERCSFGWSGRSSEGQGRQTWAFRICTNRNQIAMRPLPSPPHSENHTQTHTHSRFCSNHHRQPCSQSLLSKHSWHYTIEVFLFNLSHPTPLLPNPHPHIQHTCKKKKRNSTEPQLCKNLVCVQGMILLKSFIPPRNKDFTFSWFYLNISDRLFFSCLVISFCSGFGCWAFITLM